MSKVINLPKLPAKEDPRHEGVAGRLCLDLSGMNEEEQAKAMRAAGRHGVQNFRYQWRSSDQVGADLEGIHTAGGSMLYDLRADGNVQTLQRALAGFQLGEGDRITIDWRVNLRDQEIWEVLRELGRSILVNIEPDGKKLFPVGKLPEILEAVRRIGLGGIVCHASLFHFKDCCLDLQEFSNEGFQCLVTDAATRRYRGHVSQHNGLVLAVTVLEYGGHVCIGKNVLFQGINPTTTIAEIIEDIVPRH